MGNAYDDAYAAATNAFSEGQRQSQAFHDAQVQRQQEAAQRTAGNAFRQNDWQGGANAYFAAGMNDQGLAALNQQRAAQTRDADLRAQHAQVTLKASEGIRQYMQTHAGVAPTAAFDAVAPMLGDLGTPEEIAQFRQAFAADPQGTLDRADAFAQHELKTVPGKGGSYSVVNEHGTRVGGYDAPGEVNMSPGQHHFVENPQTHQWTDVASVAGKPPTGYRYNDQGGLEIDPAYVTGQGKLADVRAGAVANHRRPLVGRGGHAAGAGVTSGYQNPGVR